MFCEHEDNFLTVTPEVFDVRALELFRWQAEYNPVYRQFIHALKIEPDQVKTIQDIPFLPVGLFKQHPIKTTDFEPAIIFESSGTTGSLPSRHLVKSADIYEKAFMRGFESRYGAVEEWCILGLLPAYLERSGSSLVYMTEYLIRKSVHPESGFYLYDFNKLAELLAILEKRGQKTLLIGVTFALLDFARQFPMHLNHTIVMETGGMKGRRKELTREEVHEELMHAFGLSAVHAEYGMTELLSQAYAAEKGLFQCSPTMKVLIREADDPLHMLIPEKKGSTGLVNIIDLANIYSCAFIATDDIGKLYPDGYFEILGRMDSADVRGCNLMVAE